MQQKWTVLNSRLNSSPFNPNFVFGEVIECLAYSAIKKNLQIDYHFDGDKLVILLGDELRLKANSI
jgi:two-component system sensor histidine kinase BarA